MVQNIKFHLLTLASATFLAYMTASTTNLILKNTVFSHKADSKTSALHRNKPAEKPRIADYQEIINSGFFLKADPEELVSEGPVEEGPSQITDLTLLGTMTGPKSIARAIITKKGEQASEIVKVGQKIHGYVVSSIGETKVYLVSNGNKSVLDMYPPEKAAHSGGGSSKSSNGDSEVSKQQISRSELNQMLKGSMDNMLKGLRAAPYRKNGQIEGYKLKRVSSGNILYKFGIRSGDILKRINGHPITGTAKLVELWQNLPKESRVVIDVERNKDIKTFDFTIND